MKKLLALMTSSLLIASMPVCLPVSAAVKANPVISRNCPAYSGTNLSAASSGNDDYYFSFWNGSAPEDYLAYDLSGVPEDQRKIIDAVWYNTSAYDMIGLYINRNGEPSDYTIEINAAPGGEYPDDGWEIVETVSGNTLSSRQHIIDFEGYNWIRLHLTGVDEKSEGTCMINFDIHNVSDGISDSWIFYGDSITNGSMNNCFGTGFATFINQLDADYFPIQENGGIGGITSTDGLNNIDRWLSVFPGKYVSIAYGTNDAWGNQSGAQKYYENTVAMIQKVLDAGKVPILPKIPHAEESGVADYLDEYNAMIDKIYQEFPEVIKGPDFDTIMKEHPEYLSSDGVHPNSEGYEEMRRIWAETMYQNIYTADSDETPPDDSSWDETAMFTDVITDCGAGYITFAEHGTFTYSKYLDFDGQECPLTEYQVNDKLKIYFTHHNRRIINVMEVELIEEMKGDINQDGERSLLDIIQLQKYLLGKDSLPDYSAADLIEDKNINIYDLVALKILVLG